MSADADGHGPETCNYRQCGVVSNRPCPFIADAKARPAVGPCKHEWAQYYKNGQRPEHLVVDGFFCIFCLVHRDGP